MKKSLLLDRIKPLVSRFIAGFLDVSVSTEHKNQVLEGPDLIYSWHSENKCLRFSILYGYLWDKIQLLPTKFSFLFC
jgi:hypothetical protein